jgi:hypothetical protein
MSYQFGHIDPDERLDYAEETPEEAHLPVRRSLSGPALAIGVMAVFAGGLWFAYHQGTKHASVIAAAPTDNVPLIRADPQPVKVKPDKVGGMDVPDKDNPLYGAKTNAPVEKILAPPEPPAPRPTAPPVQAQLPPPPAAAPSRGTQAAAKARRDRGRRRGACPACLAAHARGGARRMGAAETRKPRSARQADRGGRACRYGRQGHLLSD